LIAQAEPFGIVKSRIGDKGVDVFWLKVFNETGGSCMNEIGFVVPGVLYAPQNGWIRYE